MTGNSQYVTCSGMFFITYSGKYQIAVVLIAVKEKTIVAVSPVFSWKKPDILRTDRKYFSSSRTVKSLHFGIMFPETVPKHLRTPFFFFCVQMF